MMVRRFGSGQLPIPHRRHFHHLQAPSLAPWGFGIEFERFNARDRCELRTTLKQNGYMFCQDNISSNPSSYTETHLLMYVVTVPP